MEWWEAFLLGLVQGLTEFLPVSSSGHLTIFREILGVDPEGFLDFTVTVHFATVLSTIVVFWSVIVKILKGLFFKDRVEALFGGGITTVAVCLIVTAVLLLFSDFFRFKGLSAKEYRNGISYWQAALVGLGQACAVAPGLSRSGTTIATGLVCGVKRENMAQFSFLMVLVPIIGEQLLSVIDMASGEGIASSIGVVPLVCGFVAAFFSGLFACRLMVALVKKSKMRWFALYCAVVAVLLLIFV